MQPQELEVYCWAYLNKSEKKRGPKARGGSVHWPKAHHLMFPPSLCFYDIRAETAWLEDLFIGLHTSAGSSCILEPGVCAQPLKCAYLVSMWPPEYTRWVRCLWILPAPTQLLSFPCRKILSWDGLKPIAILFSPLLGQRQKWSPLLLKLQDLPSNLTKPGSLNLLFL